MKRTFLNGPSDKVERGQLRKTALDHLKSRAAAFEGFMEYGNEPNSFDHTDKALKFFEDNGEFYYYGLAVDYVAAGTFEKQREGYLRYQLSYGGPSEEIRFYFSPGATEAYRITFVYLDWGVGVGFNVTDTEWAKWLFDTFVEVGTLQNEVDKATE